MASAMPAIEPATFTIDEAATMLRIGRTHCYELARQGKLPALRLGRRYVIPRAALLKMLDGTQARP